MDEMRDYLGDAVYARFDGWQIWLEVSNGVEVTDRIALEPGVQENLINYMRRVKEKYND